MEKATAVSNPSTVSENEEGDESLDESILAQGRVRHDKTMTNDNDYVVM